MGHALAAAPRAKSKSAMSLSTEGTPRSAKLGYHGFGGPPQFLQQYGNIVSISYVWFINILNIVQPLNIFFQADADGKLIST